MSQIGEQHFQNRKDVMPMLCRKHPEDAEHAMRVVDNLRIFSLHPYFLPLRLF